MSSFKEFVRMALTSGDIPAGGALHGRYDSDSVREWLEGASTAPLSTFHRDSVAGAISYRWAVRSLAALFYNDTLNEAAAKIHSILNNPFVLEGEVKQVLRGHVRDTSFETIQTIGKMLSEGARHKDIFLTTGVDVKIIRKIDRFLGVTVARKDRLLGQAISLLETERVSITTFAKYANISTWEARKTLEKARKVMQELK